MVSFSPGLILIFGALMVPLLRGAARSVYMVALPILGLTSLLLLEPGGHWHVPFLGYQLELVRVDRLANVFGIVFFLAAGLSALYALQDDDPVQQTAALIYAGSAISAV